LKWCTGCAKEEVQEDAGREDVGDAHWASSAMAAAIVEYNQAAAPPESPALTVCRELSRFKIEKLLKFRIRQL